MSELLHLQIYRKSMNIEQPTRPAALEHLKPRQSFLLLMGMFLLCYLFANIIGVLCLNWIAGLSIFEMQQMDMNNPKVLLASQVGQILGAIVVFIVPATLFTLLSSRQRADYLMINKGDKLLVFILAGIAMLGASPLINYMAELNGRIPFPEIIRSLQASADKLQDAFMKNQGPGTLVLNLFMMAALAAFAEELFFRAILQKILIKMAGNIHLGILLTGIVFSVVHLEFMGFFPRMVMGMFLGYLYVWSKTLWVPVFAHFINNASAVVLSYLEDKHVVSKAVEQIGSDNSQIMYVIASIGIVAISMVFIYKLESKKREITTG
jgi:membrane protease YdiL (CAAX protease family)